MASRRRDVVWPVLLGLFAPGPLSFANDAAKAHFENRVRPVLVAHCIKCHGPEEQSGGLRLDRPESILAGGDQGPAVMPGDPDASRLIQAIRYVDEEFQMPPKGKLPDDAIKELTTWVRDGAHHAPSAATPSSVEQAFDFDERRQHWAYQNPPPKAVPLVHGDRWSTSATDAFLLSAMKGKNLSPSAEASPKVLIRRLAFDLLGLPPTPQEIELFCSDDHADRWERWVDRFLASPAYGERWGRHWLDVVRYAESLGHEFDFELFHAWRYRDYVVRAINADLPYDQFLLEHVAGDLVESPRVEPIKRTNESVVATAFYWFGEATHSPVDVRQAQCDRIDNQIDVLSKAFLAQTVACARCHDHKFDAISMRDYYAMAGFLKSSRYAQAEIDSESAEYARTVAALMEERDAFLKKSITHSWASQTGSLPRILDSRDESGSADADIVTRRKNWSRLLDTAEKLGPAHPFFAIDQLRRNAGQGFENAVSQLEEKLSAAHSEHQNANKGVTILGEFGQGQIPDDWTWTGSAISAARKPGTVLFSENKDQPLEILGADRFHSASVSRRLEGEVRSPTFTIEHRYLHVRIRGHAVRVNVMVDGFSLIRDPIYGGLSTTIDSTDLSWRTIDVGKWKGHRAYVEILDHGVPNLTGTLDPRPSETPSESWFEIETVVTSDTSAGPSRPPHPLHDRLLKDPAPRSFDEICQRLDKEIASAFAAWGTDSSRADDADLLRALLSLEVVGVQKEDQETVHSLTMKVRDLESRIRPEPRVPAMTDGTGEDETVLLRGNHLTAGEASPRRFLQALDGPAPMSGLQGSGRLALAERMIDPSNRLVRRVIVNRLWKHHFGEGIVRSVDDFGRMGREPTHPELLDWLADDLLEADWSLKHIHRQMVATSAYRQASQPSPDARRIDPNNELLSHMPLRRLEGEAIRDNLLAASGRLRMCMEGPGVHPHLTEFMPPIGRPTSGPLDGEGRRSIYLSVRRNFLSPLLVAFDFPSPQTTMGRRNLSNVPGQSLSLLNDPFVWQAARWWAENLLHDHHADSDRLQGLYVSGLGREPTERESATALSFLHERLQSGAQIEAWTDLCHAIANLKEFIYVQ